MRRSGWPFIAVLALAPLAGQLIASPARAQDAASNFSTSDLDKNGTIDQQEYRRRMVEVFYFADQNKDGVVVIGELEKIEPTDDQAFRTADKNGDGRLTLVEFVEYRMQDFDRADTDKNSKLSPGEVAQWNSPPAAAK
jgi:hypothetical protein